MKKAQGRRVLIVEDDRHIAEGLELNLSLQGYDTAVAGSGTAGLRLWKEWNPHLIVLDVMLPGLDGLSVLRRIRLEDERLPILILSAKGSPEDRIKGLAYGVDDYLAKPFQLEEFLLRVQRLLARSVRDADNGLCTGAPGAGEEGQRYAFGGNTIDFAARTATCRRGTIRLTDQEARLLKIFVAHRGRPLSRRELLEVGWGYSGDTATRTVDNFVVRLRRYFEEDPQDPKYFRSVRSVGYVFDHP